LVCFFFLATVRHRSLASAGQKELYSTAFALFEYSYTLYVHISTPSSFAFSGGGVRLHVVRQTVSVKVCLYFLWDDESGGWVWRDRDAELWLRTEEGWGWGGLSELSWFKKEGGVKGC